MLPQSDFWWKYSKKQTVKQIYFFLEIPQKSKILLTFSNTLNFCYNFQKSFFLLKFSKKKLWKFSCKAKTCDHFLSKQNFCGIFPNKSKFCGIFFTKACVCGNFPIKYVFFEIFQTKANFCGIFFLSAFFCESFQ